MKTLFVGQKIIHLNSVDSTNNYTTGLVRQTDIAEGLVVSAEHQTNGRGQRNSKWWAGIAENLTVSIFFKPKFLKVEDQFLLSMAVALAVKQTVEAFVQTKAHVKWPNDILIEKRKIAGILIENSLKGNAIEHSIVGIGLNVNGGVSAALPQATSLFELTNKTLDRAEVLERLCEKLEANYLRLRSQSNEIAKEYNSQVLGVGSWSVFNDALNNDFEAKVVRIEKDGRMLVECKDGSTRHFGFKEITQPDIYR